MKPTSLHQHNNKLLAVVAYQISSVVPSGYNIRELLSFPEGEPLRIQHSLECHKDGYGSLAANRRWLKVRVLLRGVRTLFEIPIRTKEDGTQDTEHVYPSGLAELAACFKYHRPRKPLPFAEDDPKSPVVVLDTSREWVRPDEGPSEWSDPARPVASINTLLKRCGFKALDTPQGNELLSLLDQVLEEHTPRVEWLIEDPSETYSRESSMPFVSCMIGQNSSYFDLYDHMKREGKLRMIGIFTGRERVGRAIVWQGSNPEDQYLDRVYAPGHRSTFDKSIVEKVKAFCADEGITKTVFEQTAEWFDLVMARKFRIKVGKGPDCFSYFPYVDSLRQFGYDGWLYTYTPPDAHIVMDSTDGGASGLDDDDDDGSYVTLYNGDRSHEDDACYIEHYSEYYPAHRCSYSSHLNESVLDDESVETYDGCLIWEEDATELHDGEYAREDDSDLVQLDDGGWAIRGDCTEVDGVWYLHADAPEPEEEEETENETATA